MSLFKAGALGIFFILLISYLSYTKFANPFASKYTVHAIFSNANGLRKDSLVRIAGVNVGRVAAVEPVGKCNSTTGTDSNSGGQCSAANVTLELDNMGLPIHKDSTFAIRPRIFLEGNFFIDLRPGTPSAPIAPDGYTFPIQQGTEPVQIDQVLQTLQGDTRKNLQILLQQYGSAVIQGGPAYNRSIKFWLPAYEYSSIVAHDALGIQPHDLSNFIDKQGQVSAAFDAHPQNLQNLITDFNRTARAFAVQNNALQQAVAELPRTLGVAIPAFNSLNAAFPPLRAFARALIPGVQSTPAMVNASLPFISQLRQLVQPSELQGLVGDLRPTIPALARLTFETIPFMENQVRPASSCVVNQIMPWSHSIINDRKFNASNGFPPHQVYIEAVDFLPGLAGESRNFDANGPYIRILGNGGTVVTSLQSGKFGTALAPILGTEPALPPGGHRPPLHPNTPCETQVPQTNMQAAVGAAPDAHDVNKPIPNLHLTQQKVMQMMADAQRKRQQNPQAAGATGAAGSSGAAGSPGAAGAAGATGTAATTTPSGSHP